MNMDIRGKTIFDFCTDKDVLKFITRDVTLSEKEYRSRNTFDDYVSDLRLLAFITSDDKLGRAVFDISPLLVEWDGDVIDYATKYREKHGLEEE